MNSLEIESGDVIFLAGDTAEVSVGTKSHFSSADIKQATATDIYSSVTSNKIHTFYSC